MGDPRHQVRGGRSHDDQVGLLPQADVLHLVHGVKNIGGHRLARESLEGGGTHEVQCRAGGNHPHLVAALGEVADQMSGLIRSNAAPYADDDAERLGVQFS